MFDSVDYSGSSGSGSCTTSGPATCNLGSLASGQTSTVTITATLDGSIATAVLTEYPCLDYLLPRWAAVDATTDLLFTCPARRIARTIF